MPFLSLPTLSFGFSLSKTGNQGVKAFLHKIPLLDNFSDIFPDYSEYEQCDM